MRAIYQQLPCFAASPCEMLQITPGLTFREAADRLVQLRTVGSLGATFLPSRRSPRYIKPTTAKGYA
ncbi:MAG: hypothetical protein ACR2JE_16230, partial [Acidobacteriaceae bacterium]